MDLVYTTRNSTFIADFTFSGFVILATIHKALISQKPVRRWRPNEGPSELARCVD